MLQLDHVVYPTPDAARSLPFYRDILGLPLVHASSGDDWGGYPWLMMVFGLADGRELVLIELKGAGAVPFPLPADSRHIAMGEASVDRLEGWRGKLRGAGVDFWEESHGVQQSLYFADPAGLILEITAPPKETAQPADPKAAAIVERWLSEAALTP